MNSCARAADKVAAGHTADRLSRGHAHARPGQALLPFKPGFVLIARRARVPIQLVRITTDSDLLTKGCAWWRLPRFPAHVEVTAGPLISTDTAASTAELNAGDRGLVSRPAPGALPPVFPPRP